MARTLAWTWLAMIVATAAAPGAADEAPPVTVAILDYEASSPGNPKLGTQMADILTARLSVEDAFDLVERAKLDRILEEQKLKLVGLADPDQAAEVGKLVGARLMVMGKAFLMDKQLMIVTKIVGVETGLVKGTIRQVEASKPISEAILLLADDVAALIRKDAPRLLPEGARVPDPIAQLREELGDRPLPVVAVVVPEQHRTRVVVDPAVETEIKRTLLACGFQLVDIGRNDLADWAKKMLSGDNKAWPPALTDADVVVVGEAFSEFALRTGDLVTCTGRAEINVIDRHTGRILLADRHTGRAVDLAEVTAGKTALQAAGRKLALAVARCLKGYKPAQPEGDARADPTPVRSQPLALVGEGVALASPFERECFLFAALPPADLIPSEHVPRARPIAAQTPDPVPADQATEQATPAPAEDPAPVRRTVFAAHFDNETGRDQYEPAAAGLGDLVAVFLAKQPHIDVAERQRLASLTSEQARSLKGLTGQTYALKAGMLLKADTVLTGRLFLVDNRLTVNVKALDIASERIIAADQIACRPEYLLEAALQMARRLGDEMALPLPAVGLDQIDKTPIASLHFGKALGCYYAGNVDEAIMQFMRTLDLDPNYTEVHYWIGKCYWNLAEWPHAVIEWEAFLKEHPDSSHAPQAREQLKQARQREAESAPPRFSPEPAAAENETEARP